MTAFVLTDCTAWVDGFAATTYSNQLSVGVDVDDQDTTTFGGGGWRSRIGGLKTVEAELQGLWESPVDDTWSNLGVADRVVTFTPDGAAGSPSWFFQAGEFSYERLGDVGELDPFTLKAMGTNGVGLVAGKLAAAKQNVSATGVIGSVVTNLSSNSQVSASQYLYAAVHVFTAGTTVTIKVQSDDAAGFPSSTDRITLSAITTTGGTWVTRLAGPITDTHYRLNVSAITGTFNLAGSIGIA